MCLYGASHLQIYQIFIPSIILGRRRRSHPQFVDGKTKIYSLNNSHIARNLAIWRADS